MTDRRIPVWLRHATAPRVRDFGALAGLEAVVRGMLISVFPLVMYKALGDAGLVSAVYFGIGLLSLVTGLLVPGLIRFLPRRWVYTAGSLMFVASSMLAVLGGGKLVIGALMLNTMATVTCFICFNAYVLDYISRLDLGKCESSRMFYSAAGWTMGPVLGVTLMRLWEPAPFVISGTAALLMLALFWYLRMGNGKQITKARAPAANPLAYLPRFFAQPRLIAGWLFAVIRSCGWWVYVVYLPIFSIQSGLGDQLGGILLSCTNATLFAAPVILRWVQRRPLKSAVRTGFAGAGFCFVGAAALSALPPAAVAALVIGSGWLIVLDVCGGLPFLMAVKPSERTEMSAVYSSYRDVSGIMTPGAAWIVLQIAPLAGVFAAGGLAMFVAWRIAARLHPRLGQARMRSDDPEPPGAIAAGS